MTFFDYERIAKGYALDRTLYHTPFMEIVKEHLKITELFDNGLDVGCGAGSSAVALKVLCKNVTGIDESEEMIKAANTYCKDKSIAFKKCPAEQIPVENQYDIITAAGSINWIDENIFLNIAHKILTPNGYLIIYDNPMINQMEGVPSFTSWWNEQYLQRFPKPYRKENVWNDDTANRYGFRIIEQFTVPNQSTMSLEQLTAYLITQTNVISRIEHNGQDLNEAIQWFNKTLLPVFDGKDRSLCFEGYIWILQKHL